MTPRLRLNSLDDAEVEDRKTSAEIDAEFASLLSEPSWLLQEKAPASARAQPILQPLERRSTTPTGASPKCAPPTEAAEEDAEMSALKHEELAAAFRQQNRLLLKRQDQQFFDFDTSGNVADSGTPTAAKDSPSLTGGISSVYRSIQAARRLSHTFIEQKNSQGTARYSE